jgi:antitoxin component of RelBE/YafQ-DinJ toxin-antitoxin module
MDKETFKRLISYLESSSGKQTDHPMVTSGIQKNTKAIGEYGLMPNTAIQMAKERVINNKNTPLDDIIMRATPQQVPEILKDNPQRYQDYVDDYADKALMSSDTPTEAATRWIGGVNAKDADLSRIQEKNSGRMNKLREFMDKKIIAPPQDILETVKPIPEEVIMSKIKKDKK